MKKYFEEKILFRRIGTSACRLSFLLAYAKSQYTASHQATARRNKCLCDVIRVSGGGASRWGSR